MRLLNYLLLTTIDRLTTACSVLTFSVKIFHMPDGEITIHNARDGKTYASSQWGKSHFKSIFGAVTLTFINISSMSIP